MTTRVSHHRFPAFDVGASGRCHPAHARGACPPGREVPRRIQVGVDLETAALAPEEILAWPVAPLGVAATRAALRGVPRVFLDDLDAGQCRLVPEEREQLREWPRVEHSADLDRPLASLPDARQPLNVEHATGSGDDIDDLPADIVVHAGYPSGLLALGPHDHPRLAPLLECLAIAEVAAPDVPEGCDRASAKDFGGI